MLRRILLGVLKGTLIGALVGVLFVYGLGIPLLAGVAGYLAAIVTGVFVALLAGKPIWASGAWIEVLLKGVAAAVLGAGALWAVRAFLEASISVGPLGQGLLSELPFVMLPLVATLLAVFFEVDNTDEPEATPPGDHAKRLRVNGDGAASDEADALEPASERAEQRRASHKLQ